MRIAQIGSQSCLSILKSGLLSNIDTVIITHISRTSLLCNIMSLLSYFTELQYGIGCIVDTNCFLSVLRAFGLCLQESTKEKNECLLLMLQFIQRVVLKSSRGFELFLTNNGYDLVMTCWQKSSGFMMLRKEVLNCLCEVLQHEEGNEQLQYLHLVEALLQEKGSETSSDYLRDFWNTINSFLQFHGEILTQSEEELILAAILHALKDGSQIGVVARPLFTLISFSVFSTSR